MNINRFTINNTFLVQQDIGIVRSLVDGKEERLEPRLMQLLCILAGQPGELLSRERLVLEVWDNYGNADEGLTQAISYLRKVLKDNDKRLIETVPKKGYVLHAVIGTDLPELTKRRTTFVFQRWFLWLIVLLVAAILIGGYWFLWRNNRPGSSDLIPADHVADTGSNKHPAFHKGKDHNHNADQLPDSVNKTNPSSDSKK